MTPPPPYSEIAEDGHVSLGRGSFSPFKLSIHEDLLNRSLPTGRLSYPLDMQQQGSSLELMEDRPAPPLQLPGVPQDQHARLSRSLSLPPAVTWSPFLLPSLMHPPSPWSLTPPPLTLSPSHDTTDLPRLPHPHTMPLPPSRLPPLTHHHTSTRLKTGRRRRRRHTRTAPEPINMSTVT